MSLRIERLVVRRGGRTVIDGLDLAVGPGEKVGVVGKNGCGKSTLLMAIAGVLAPTEGRVSVAGASVWGTSKERRRARTALGYVPEGADAPGFLRASELWALCAAARGVAPPSPELTLALGLDELAELALDRMSLGQRRRSCLAAALLGPPALLVLDEPDNGLDARRMDALVELVRDHPGATIVSTHDRSMLDAFGTRTVELPAV
jgi:ABC-type multidrug transport system ATPase subunit